MLILIIISLLSGTYILFDNYCRSEWAKEDSELFLTEGTGHD
jgi:hypothetical protein